MILHMVISLPVARCCFGAEFYLVGERFVPGLAVGGSQWSPCSSPILQSANQDCSTMTEAPHT
jgi:hypothetical protein